MEIPYQPNNELNDLLHEQHRLVKIRQYINDHLPEDLKAAVLSGKFQLSISSLQHLFKKYEHQSYHRYVETVRIKKAFDLITQEGMSVKEAMFATGYNNRITFNTAFKKIFKHPPSYFIK